MDPTVDAVPGLPALDTPVPLMVKQKVEEYEVRMDRIDDLVLVGAPVSAADREAWRCWANSSSSSGPKRKKKRRRKKKLPKTTALDGTGGAVWRSLVAPFSDVISAFDVESDSWVSQVQFSDKVFLARWGKPVEIPEVQF